VAPPSLSSLSLERPLLLVLLFSIRIYIGINYETSQKEAL
jgi:hypothetical protein